jgi:hypothetical protein
MLPDPLPDPIFVTPFLCIPLEGNATGRKNVCAALHGSASAMGEGIDWAKTGDWQPHRFCRTADMSAVLNLDDATPAKPPSGARSGGAEPHVPPRTRGLRGRASPLLYAREALRGPAITFYCGVCLGLRRKAMPSLGNFPERIKC